MNVPQSDLSEIKRRLMSIEQRQHESATQYAVLINTVQNIEKGLPSQINAIVSDRLAMHGKTGRETSGWVIGMISFGFMIIFGLLQIGLGIWT